MFKNRLFVTFSASFKSLFLFLVILPYVYLKKNSKISLYEFILRNIIFIREGLSRVTFCILKSAKVYLINLFYIPKFAKVYQKDFASFSPCKSFSDQSIEHHV